MVDLNPTISNVALNNNVQNTTLKKQKNLSNHNKQDQ